jgi:hypothetical protein
LLTNQSALAHVKWFCAYNVAETPQPLHTFVDEGFGLLVAISIGLFILAVVLDQLFIGQSILWSIDRVTGGLRLIIPDLMRATYGAFFVALWTHGGIILTPELLTPIAAISWLQLVIAACFIWRQTLPVAAAGIVALYFYGLTQYGLFHMLDYPIFLGAAAYFALTGLRWRPYGVLPLDVARIAAAVTLLWASVEKWGYPQWSYPLFITHPAMAMGYSPPFYMKAAGIVEFSLAFALLGTPLMRRTAAIILTSMFTAAIFEFGKVDAIGHAPIIVILLAIASDNRPGRARSTVLMPAGYLASLVAVISCYYGIHAALF